MSDWKLKSNHCANGSPSHMQGPTTEKARVCLVDGINEDSLDLFGDEISKDLTKAKRLSVSFGTCTIRVEV